MYPKVFEDVVESFMKLPGVGHKSAQRLAYHLLTMKQDDINSFSKSLLELGNHIKYCKICGHMSDTDICYICSDDTRNIDTICVVENFQDVYAMEKIREYNGLYHVLNGTVSMLEGRSIEDLNIFTLMDRINENIDEIIIATNPTREGETTALYLAKLLETKNVKTSRIANGLPIGSNIDYADELTLLRSLEGRTKI